jgi:predicted DNA-binding transcriptional regulator YafY
MRRADRLFQIIQILRRSRRPITADAMALELETSKRTVYRDIADLMAQRVPIRGEAGIGYILDNGYDLPPLMLTPDEIEAAVLGAHVIGADVSEIEAARDQFRAMLMAGGPPPQGRFKDLAVLEPVKDYPARHASSLLAFEAALAAVRMALSPEATRTSSADAA